MADPTVWTFLYGSSINLSALQEVNLEPAEWEVARLSGCDIRIEPRANLVRSGGAIVYGIVATATHDELARLATHVRDVLGERYLPEPVLAHTLDGTWRPALCSICPHMESRPADAAYVERIIVPAREYGFPGRYLDRLARFRP